MPFKCYSKQFVHKKDKLAGYHALDGYPYVCPIKCGQARCCFSETEYQERKAKNLHEVCRLNFQAIVPVLMDRRTYKTTSKW